MKDHFEGRRDEPKRNKPCILGEESMVLREETHDGNEKTFSNKKTSE